MARGSQQAADSVSEQSGKKIHDWALDTFEVLLASDTFAAAANFTNRIQFTEVTGGAYAAKPTAVTWLRSGSNSTWQATSVTWATDASGPQDCRIAVVVNTQAGVVGNDDVLSIIDLTSDGTTPIDNQLNAIAVNFSSSPTIQVVRT